MALSLCASLQAQIPKVFFNVRDFGATGRVLRPPCDPSAGVWSACSVEVVVRVAIGAVPPTGRKNDAGTVKVSDLLGLK